MTVMLKKGKERYKIHMYPQYRYLTRVSCQHKNMFKKLLLVFFMGFALNLIWEFSHSVLYASYRGGEITNLVLFRAAVWDGVFIAVLVLLATIFKINKWAVIIFGGLILAVAIELWALKNGRWVYDAAMPIIPILNTGFTPTIQLALTGYIAVWYTFRVKSKLII